MFMRPRWGQPGSCRPQMGPKSSMIMSIVQIICFVYTLLRSRVICTKITSCSVSSAPRGHQYCQFILSISIMFYTNTCYNLAWIKVRKTMSVLLTSQNTKRYFFIVYWFALQPYRAFSCRKCDMHNIVPYTIYGQVVMSVLPAVYSVEVIYLEKYKSIRQAYIIISFTNC